MTTITPYRHYTPEKSYYNRQNYVSESDENLGNTFKPERTTDTNKYYLISKVCINYLLVIFA